jgi:hypothetical protein
MQVGTKKKWEKGMKEGMDSLELDLGFGLGHSRKKSIA